MRVLLIMLFFAAMLPASSQSVVGCFDYDKVFQTLPEYAESQKKLNSLKISLQDSLDMLLYQFESYMQSLIGDHLFDSITKEIVNDSLGILTENIEKFRSIAREKLAEEELVAVELLKSELADGLAVFCMKNNYECVLEKDALLYGVSCMDVTADLIVFFRER